MTSQSHVKAHAFQTVYVAHGIVLDRAPKVGTEQVHEVHSHQTCTQELHTLEIVDWRLSSSCQYLQASCSHTDSQQRQARLLYALRVFQSHGCHVRCPSFTRLQLATRLRVWLSVIRLIRYVMPRELITIQVGQCGNQIGHRFWELALREHATYNPTGLFDEAMSRCFWLCLLLH